MSFKKNLNMLALGLSLSFSILSQASPLYEITGSHQVDLFSEKASNLNNKTISLLNVNLSQDFIVLTKNRSKKFSENEKDYSKGITFSTKHDLGMANTPVLDQGSYGTCVTFSTTGALDALIQKGDYIDQQCSLEVDIADPDPNDYYFHGNYWNGAFTPSQIIDPLMKHGIISKGNCFGANYPEPNTKLQSIDQYEQSSDKTSLSKVEYNYIDTESLSLDSIKRSINSNHRILIGSMIGKLVAGFDVIKDGKHNRGGLWACKQNNSRNYCDKNNIAGGHEIIVIGYDDDAQLLKIRNSWNTDVGNNGDYYMTYKYFNAMAMDATEISNK